MALYERISLVVSLVLLGLLAFLLIDLPTRAVELTLLGSPLTLIVSEQWLMAVLLGGLAGTGTRAIIQGHPGLVYRAQDSSFSFWLLPALLAILVTMLLPWASISIISWVIGILGTGALLWFTILAEYHSLMATDRWYRLSHVWLNLVSYSVALGFFFAIYQSRARSLISASAVLLVTGLLTISQLRGEPEGSSGKWIFAGIIALVMAQSTWALNYWRIPSLTASLWLLLIYYLFTGLAQQQILGRLTRRAVLEYAGVTLVGLAIIFQFVP